MSAEFFFFLVQLKIDVIKTKIIEWFLVLCQVSKELACN